MSEFPVFDGCEVVEKLRSGPVADLYHALQQPLGRPVLIKALTKGILPSSPFAASLEREALVLEYVDGWPADELLKSCGKLPPLAAAAVALEVALALEHAHRRGVVHRDVQPKNVMISKRGQVKLLNFSVAVDERLPTAPELLD